MITIDRTCPTADARWCDFARELDGWEEVGRTATLWWRDDDAVVPSRRLDTLLRMAGEVPVALAVIPASVEPELASFVCDGPAPVKVLQHGWRHINHATTGKKAEFPPCRAPQEIAGDLAAGRVRLNALFGARALAVLAPPWNRFHDDFLPLLVQSGIGAISRIKSRPARWPAAGVFEANIHIDLVAWRAHRGFVGEAAALGGLIGHLRARRCGRADPDEPTGILTHHPVQDRATGAFLERLLKMTREHPAARWLDAGEVFAPAVAAQGAFDRG
jgi:hypothetical protein